MSTTTTSSSPRTGPEQNQASCIEGLGDPHVMQAEFAMSKTPHEPRSDENDPNEITQLISALAVGDRSAGDRLLELVYSQLRPRSGR